MLLNCGVGEDSESPLNCKKIQPVHPKGNQSWIFIGRTDAEAETLIGHLMWKADSLEKTPDAGKDWRQEEKGTTEDEMVGCIQWTWVWPKSRSWWWTGKPGVLQSLGSQRVGHDWATELKRSLVNFFNKQPNQFKKYQRVFLYRKKKSYVLQSYINLKHFLIIKCKTARISEPLLSQPQPQQNMKMYITHKKLNEWAMGEHILKISLVVSPKS